MGKLEEGAEKVSVLAIFAGPWGCFARLGIVAAACAMVWFHGWFKGNEHGTQKLSDYQAAEARADTKLQAARQVIVTQIQIKYRDRIQEVLVAGQTIEKEVVRYVTKEDDAAVGSVPVGAVRVFNAAWSGAPAGPPAESDRRPSGYPLSELTAADAHNATSCRVWKSQRDGLIELYRNLQRLDLEVKGQP